MKYHPRIEECEYCSFFWDIDKYNSLFNSNSLLTAFNRGDATLPLASARVISA